MKEYHYLTEFRDESDSLVVVKKINTNNYSHRKKVRIKKLSKQIRQLIKL